MSRIVATVTVAAGAVDSVAVEFGLGDGDVGVDGKDETVALCNGCHSAGTD